MFLFRSDHIFLISQIIDVIGVLGFAVAILSLILSGRWDYASVAASFILVATYLLRWAFLTDYIYAGSPELGLNAAIERLIHLWIAEFSAKVANAGLMQALLSLYWNVAMAFVQLLVILIWGWSLRRINRTSHGKA